MKQIFNFIILLFITNAVLSQTPPPPPPSETTKDIPSFIPPTPEATAILKADILSVGHTTGSPNINIPLYNLQQGGYSLPIALNYSSTGVKVNEIASMVGIGWSLTYGGVVSRTVMDKPDELRDANNCNLNAHNFANPDYELIQFLQSSNADTQSDIYSFSFGGISGKFILDLNLQPIQLTRKNLKIEIINGSFLEGFIITTDDGTQYHFKDWETSTDRNPTGTKCKVDELSLEEVKTSWFLTKIVLPSIGEQINFTYATSAISFQSSIEQTITLNVAAEDYLCNTSISGPACPVNQITYRDCKSRQLVQSKFISKIETSDGDKLEFFYDPVLRSDLQGGVRLSSIKISNWNSIAIKYIVFNGTYKFALNGSLSFESYRLFLESVLVRDGNNSSANQLRYTFNYDDYAGLHKRLGFAQDLYGYFNGKTNNQSLIPKLLPGDINYAVTNNGTSIGTIQFGDRAIDTAYSRKGLLNKIIYPTGGYDTIVYTPNYKSAGIFCGGHSVSKITSYLAANVIALEKQYIYRDVTNNALSTFLITDGMLFFSYRAGKTNDGYVCSSNDGSTVAYCVGPSCTQAIISSNANNALTTHGSEHVYHRTVQEKTTNAGIDMGIVEHKYQFFMEGSLTANVIMGSFVLNAPLHIVPDLVVAEVETNIYKNASPSTATYQLVKSSVKTFDINNFSHYSNYAVRQIYNTTCSGGPDNPPHSSEIQAFDVTEVYVYTYTAQLNNIVEMDYTGNGQLVTKTTTLEYSNSAYTYPTKITTTQSDGLQFRVEKKYPPDYSALTFMTNRNMISPVIEEKSLKNNILQITKTQLYLNWFSNNTLLAPQYVEIKFGADTMKQKTIFHSYDIYGNVLEVSKEANQHFSYLWDYKSNYPIAKIQNAENKDVAYTSFEADGKGNWNNYTGTISTPSVAPFPPTGNKYYNLTSSNTLRKTVVTGDTYIVSYWSKSSTPYTILAEENTYKKGATINGWTYYEHKILTATTTLSITGTGSIDEVRLYPEGAQMTTYTYKPLIGITSQCDINNRITYYEHDDFGRLKHTLDQKRNILNKYCYNYAGQTIDCRPTNGPGVYGRITYENQHTSGTTVYGDVVLRLYQNEACTTDLTVSNMPFNYNYFFPCYETLSSSVQTVTVSGKSYVLKRNETLGYWDSREVFRNGNWITEEVQCFTKYYLINNSAYQVVQ